MTTPALYTQQIKIEKQSLALGQERYAEAVAKARSSGSESELGPVRNLIQQSLGAVAEAIAFKRAPKGAGRALAALKFLEGIEDSALAFHALRGCFASVSTPTSLTQVAVGIGTGVLEEHRFRKLEEVDGKLYRMTQVHIKEATTGVRKRRIMNHMSQQVSLEWTDTQKLQVGIFLIDAVTEATPLFKTGMIRRSKTETVRILEATEEVLQWLNEGHERSSMFMPIRMPMVVPPRDWDSPRDGGYLTDIGGRLDMIKTRNKPYLESLGDIDMPTVYAALNAIQAVPWAINKQVLAVANQCWLQGVEVGSSMPCKDFLPMPASPCDPSELPALRKNDPATYKEWAQRAASVHADNAKSVSRRSSCGSRLNIAEDYAKYDAMYFPHQMDFRGRMYPIPVHLHPQADDLARGLLQLAQGKVPGERGMFWLGVHIANCHGVDKVTHEQRVAWAQARMPLWLEIAADPMACRDWMTAEDPWQALAAILEYVRCTQDGEAMGQLSIPMDGSNNGLQNFSSLMRDEVGAAATNVSPCETPADVYMQVADIVTKMVDLDAAMGNEFAIIWQGKINRKLVKQPVMTLAYGATMSGMRGQLESAMKKLYPGLFSKAKSWAACGYLATVTYAAIGKVVVSAREAMVWLQSVARLVASVDYPIRWTAPNGLPVLQDYRVLLSTRVKVHVDGVEMQVEVARDGDKLDRRRQSLAISPNLIHSFDAAHLQGTVMLCLEQGLTGFSFIHDSYGTLAADVDTLHWCLREAFIRQYTPNLLQEFADEVRAQLTDDMVLPSLPAMGTLDLSLVHQSRYFFS